MTKISVGRAERLSVGPNYPSFVFASVYFAGVGKLEYKVAKKSDKLDDPK